MDKAVHEPEWVGTHFIRCSACGRVDDYKYFAPYVSPAIHRWLWECDLCQFTRRLEGEYESDLAHGHTGTT